MKNFKFLNIAMLVAFTSPALLGNNPTYPTPADIVKGYFSHFETGNFTEAEKLFSSDLQVQTPLAPQILGKQAWLETMKSLKAAFPDLKHQVNEYVEQGFSIAVKGVFTGQNNGPIMGAPPTGNRVSLAFIAVFELDNSWKIKSINSQFDMKSFEAQLMAGLPDPIAAAELNIRSMLAASDEGNA